MGCRKGWLNGYLTVSNEILNALSQVLKAYILWSAIPLSRIFTTEIFE